jgi:hypothetical protein
MNFVYCMLNIYLSLTPFYKLNYNVYNKTRKGVIQLKYVLAQPVILFFVGIVQYTYQMYMIILA